MISCKPSMFWSNSSCHIEPIFLPIRSAESVWIRLIFPHECFGSSLSSTKIKT